MITRSQKNTDRMQRVRDTHAAVRATGFFDPRYLLAVELVRTGNALGIKSRPPKKRVGRKTRPGLVRLRLLENWLEKVHPRGAVIPGETESDSCFVLDRDNAAIPAGFDDAARLLLTRGGSTSIDRVGVLYAGRWFVALTLTAAAALAEREMADRLNLTFPTPPTEAYR